MKRQKGFTLVELIMALAFFSFMMAILSIGVVQIMRIYQAGVSQRRTQQAARVAMEDITREVRATTRIMVATNGRLCLDGAAKIDYQLVGGELLKRTGFTDCNNANTSPTKLIETSPGNNNLVVRVFNNFAVTNPSNGQNTSVDVNLLVTTGADDLLNGNACIPGVTGSQYCATTQFSNTISLRGS